MELPQLIPLSDQEFEARRATTMHNFEGTAHFPNSRLNEADVMNMSRFFIRDEINGSLVRLDLGQNRIGNRSAMVLAAAIINQ